MTLTASCHCGALRIDAPGLPDEAKSCNCTYCHRTGAIWGYYEPDALTITATGPIGDYAPNVVNNHYFCAACGGNTHGSSPDWGSIYNMDGTLKPGAEAGVPDRRIAAINLRMVDGLDLDTLEIEALDGRNNW